MKKPYVVFTPMGMDGYSSRREEVTPEYVSKTNYTKLWEGRRLLVWKENRGQYFKVDIKTYIRTWETAIVWEESKEHDHILKMISPHGNAVRFILDEETPYKLETQFYLNYLRVSRRKDKHDLRYFRSDG